MVDRVEHFIKTDQLWGVSQRPFQIFATGCTAAWDDQGLGIQVVYPYIVDEILPAVVLVQRRNGLNDYWFFIVTTGEPVRLDIPSTMSRGEMRLDGDGICFADGLPKCVSSENPYMFRAFLWAGMKGQSPQELLIEMARRHLGCEFVGRIPAEIMMFLIPALERCGRMQEKLALWSKYAREMNGLLGANVQKHEKGMRPSAMFQLSRTLGHERDVDEVLGRDLATLERLGWMDEKCGVPKGALELLAAKH